MPAWFVNESEVERRGASALLSACKEFMPARSALELLNAGVSPSAAGQALASFFKQNTEHIQKLEDELRSCQFERDSSKSLLASFYNDPDHARLLKAEQELKQQTQRAERAEKSAEKNETDLYSTLERERKFHAEQMHALKQQVLELNRLVASQHKRLEELTGPDLSQ